MTPLKDQGALHGAWGLLFLWTGTPAALSPPETPRKAVWRGSVARDERLSSELRGKVCQDLPRRLGQGRTRAHDLQTGRQGEHPGLPVHHLTVPNHGGCAPLSVRHVYELGEAVCVFTHLHFLIFYYIERQKNTEI